MLTINEIKALKPKNRQYEVFEDNREKGTGRLGITIGTSGSKIFIYRFYWDGKRQFMQLGKFPQMSLSVARDLTKFYGGQLKAGMNPKAELERQKIEQNAMDRAESEKGSIQQLIYGYVGKMKADGKRTHADVLRRLEKDVYPVIPALTKAKNVTPNQIKQILSKMIQRNAVVQSNRVRSYLHAAFEYGLKADNDPMNNHLPVMFGLTMNPVSVIPRQAAAERVGDNWLKLAELQQLMDSFTNTPKVGWLVGQLLKLCIYTGGQRPYELIASEWCSIDWKEKTWLITSQISKNKREHLVPLTDTAISLLKELQKMNSDNSQFIFPKKRGVGHFRTDSFAQAIIYFRSENPEFPCFMGRDIRRTCKTLMGELGISKELRDRLQNHAFQDVSSKHYDRYSYLIEKRSALEAWEARLNNQILDNKIVNIWR